MKQRGQFKITGGKVYRQNHNHDSLGDCLANLPEGMTVAEARGRLREVGPLAGLSANEKRARVKAALAGTPEPQMPPYPSQRRPGRPPTGRTPAPHRNVQIADGDDAHIVEVGGGNRAAGIRELVARDRARAARRAKTD